jgi:hypothetical protein
MRNWVLAVGNLEHLIFFSKFTRDWRAFAHGELPENSRSTFQLLNIPNHHSSAPESLRKLTKPISWLSKIRILREVLAIRHNGRVGGF